MSRIYDNLERLSQEFSTEDHIKHSNDINRIRSASKRSSSKSFISRSVRAKRRRAFLRTYQLSSPHNSGEAAESSNCHEKLRQAAIKLKSVVVSWAAAARFSLLRRRCSLRRLLCASISPSRSIRSGWLRSDVILKTYIPIYISVNFSNAGSKCSYLVHCVLKP